MLKSPLTSVLKRKWKVNEKYVNLQCVMQLLLPLCNKVFAIMGLFTMAYEIKSDACKTMYRMVASSDACY